MTCSSNTAVLQAFYKRKSHAFLIFLMTAIRLIGFQSLLINPREQIIRQEINCIPRFPKLDTEPKAFGAGKRCIYKSFLCSFICCNNYAFATPTKKPDDSCEPESANSPSVCYRGLSEVTAIGYSSLVPSRIGRENARETIPQIASEINLLFTMRTQFRDVIKPRRFDEMAKALATKAIEPLMSSPSAATFRKRAKRTDAQQPGKRPASRASCPSNFLWMLVSLKVQYLLPSASFIHQ